MSKEYRVTWEIDIVAGDPVAAARTALRIQRDPESTAMVFEVRNRSSSLLQDTYEVDLNTNNPRCTCKSCGRPFEMLKKHKTKRRKT